MLKQFGVIICITYVGNILSEISGLPIPGTVVGMLLLFILLYFKVIKLSTVEKASEVV